MTARLIRAIEHPLGRHHRPPDQPHAAAARAGARSTWTRVVAAPPPRTASRSRSTRQIDRLDLSDVNARLARERGVKLVISSDAHSRAALATHALGRASSPGAPGRRRRDVLNTLPFDEFRRALRRNRSRAA